MRLTIPYRFLTIIGVGLLLLSSCGQQKLDFPKGFTPKETGNLLAHRFLQSDHQFYGDNGIHYAEVCTWIGALKYAQQVDDSALLGGLIQRFEPFFTTRKGLLPPTNHVDFNVFGSLALELYLATGDNRFLELGLHYANAQWELPNNPSEVCIDFAAQGLSWQTRYWIDDMFMVTLLQSQAYLATGNRMYIDRAAHQMVAYLDSLQRPNGLFFHSPNAPFYWGRGNGWMAAGMTFLLKSLPADNPHRERILASYRLMMSSLKQYQLKNGMWSQLIDQPTSWAETSCTAMFTFSIVSGLGLGWIERGDYADVAHKAWLALIPFINSKGDVREVCIGTGIGNDIKHYLDRPRITGDFHGQAPVLWSAWAWLENYDKLMKS